MNMSIPEIFLSQIISNRIIKDQRGFIALISVLIISAVVLTIGISVSLRSIGEMKMSFDKQESRRALALAGLCAEQALMKLESVFNYAGNESITIDGESCDILPIGGSGITNRTISAQSTVSNYTKKIKIEVTQISPVLEIASWQEVANF